MNDNSNPLPFQPALLPPAPRRWTDHRIEICQVEKLREAWEFARDNNLQAQFCEAFVRMLSLMSSFVTKADKHGRDLRGQIGFDGCLHSFRWHTVMVEPGGDPNKINRRDQGFLMNGGLIYHGPGQGETHAVQLTANRDNPWSIHT